MKNEEKENIYDKTIVICEDENHYCVGRIDNEGRFIVAEASTAQMALQLKKAYCDGWYDATHREA